MGIIQQKEKGETKMVEAIKLKYELIRVDNILKEIDREIFFWKEQKQKFLNKRIELERSKKLFR
jgi:hypothetical protein